MYDSRKHMGEMIALFGHPPKELLKREAGLKEAKWKQPLENVDGKLCWTAHNFYRGPFFNSEGI